MNLINIHGHTIDKSLLRDGCIIDVGCRGFKFAKYFNPSRKVYCIDPDPEVFKDDLQENFECMNVAVSDKNGESTFYRNGEMTCLCEILTPLPHLIEPCKTISMGQIYANATFRETVDVLKLDCEGAEYLILGDKGFCPIPRQITVEFHKHFVPDIHKERIDQVMANVMRYYDLVYQHENGMDNLFIRR
jgi:FkbM family methyltransferase